MAIIGIFFTSRVNKMIASAFSSSDIRTANKNGRNNINTNELASLPIHKITNGELIDTLETPEKCIKRILNDHNFNKHVGESGEEWDRGELGHYP